MLSVVRNRWIEILIFIALLVVGWQLDHSAADRAKFNCNVQRTAIVEGNKRAQLANDMRDYVVRFLVEGKSLSATAALAAAKVEDERAHPLPLPDCARVS